jgi:hypothetical protein
VRWAEVICEANYDDDIREFVNKTIMFMRAEMKDYTLDLNKVVKTAIQNGYDLTLEDIKELVDEQFSDVDGVERNDNELIFKPRGSGSGSDKPDDILKDLSKDKVEKDAADVAKQSIKGGM